MAYSPRGGSPHPSAMSSTNTGHPSLAAAIDSERARILQISDVFDVPNWAVLEAFLDSGTGPVTDARAPAPYRAPFHAATVPMGI